MGERADRVEGEVAPGLQPDLRADVVEHPRAEAGLDQQVMKFLHPLAGGAVELADREAVALDVRHHAGLGDGGGGIDDAAHAAPAGDVRSAEHTSELQSLMRISSAVFSL